jgi:ribose 5-phosphate isomerase A
VAEVTSEERRIESNDLATLLLSRNPAVDFTRPPGAFAYGLSRSVPPVMDWLEEELKSEMKKRVALKAIDEYIESDMVVGLGTGETVALAVERMGNLIQEGKLRNIVAVPASLRAKELAQKFGIPVISDISSVDIDVALSGADELDEQLNFLISGGGGNLQQGKMVAERAKKLIVIIDESKLTDRLGKSFALPIEVVPSSWEETIHEILHSPFCDNCEAKLRLESKGDSDAPVITDNGNYIVDLFFSNSIADAFNVDQQLKKIEGVVEHGLFCKMTRAAFMFGKSGMRVWQRQRSGFDDGYYQGLLIKTNY